jgi:glycosyltransferase involved in cell wall biosynthesis
VLILHVLAERGFSGGENQLLATLRYLQGRGHEQILVVTQGARFSESARQLGIPVHELKIRHNYDLVAALALRKHYRSIVPDLVHLTCSRSHKIGAMAGIFGSALPPKVVTRRMDYPIRNTWFRRWIYRRAVDGVVAISQGVLEAVLAVGVDRSKVHLINEGVDTRHFGELRTEQRRGAARQRLELGDNDILGVTTASLHVRKAHDVLLEALGKVAVPNGKRIVWLFGGDGPERSKLLSQADQLPEQFDIRIPGQIDYVDDALAAADLYCLPSRYEGLGVALLEALATGAPCIASRVGGMREVLESGVSGIHVEVEDVGGLTAAIQSLVDDPVLAERLGVAGMQRAKDRFDISLMGRKTEALYESLVS